MVVLLGECGRAARSIGYRLESQPDVSLTLNYPPTSLIFGIVVDMAGVGGVDRAIGEDGAGDEGIAGEEGAVGDQGALGEEEGVVDAGA